MLFAELQHAGAHVCLASEAANVGSLGAGQWSKQEAFGEPVAPDQPLSYGLVWSFQPKEANSTAYLRRWMRALRPASDEQFEA